MEENKAKLSTAAINLVDGDETTSMLSSSSVVHEMRNSTHDVAISSKANVANQRSPLWRVALLLSSLLVPLFALIWWIVDVIWHRSDVLGATIIGGQLSYIQAKAIDFVSGAVFAPLLMVLLDSLWFSNAHVSVVNEQQKGMGVSLPSLIEASRTSVGGFNPLKLRALLEGRT